MGEQPPGRVGRGFVFSLADGTRWMVDGTQITSLAAGSQRLRLA
jgi:hypothetical protein